jgi:hypothetical protein
VTGCFCKAGAGLVGELALHNIDRPNPRPLPAGEWVGVNTKYPAVVVCMGTDPGGNLVAVPDVERNSTTEVYTSIGTGANRALYLPVPGRWKIQNTGGVAITGLVLDTPDAIAALVYGGLKIGGGQVDAVLVAPTVLTMAPATGVVVGVTDTLVLAANPIRRALWVGVTGAVAGRASFSFDGGAAVIDVGLTSVGAAGGYAENAVEICRPPGPAFVGSVRAIGSAAGVKVWAQEAT